MTAKNIDIANIFLMLLSCVAAYLLPFELFLFSYAVLGPLHYLTEISWLHQRSYFTTGKLDYTVFVVLGSILTLLVLMGAGPIAQQWSNTLIFVCFASALGMVLLKDWLQKLLVICAALLLGFAVSSFKGFEILFGIFLPTLIHVFVFTGIFIVYGALKSKSKTGLLSALVFLVCGFSFFFFRPDFAWYKTGEYAIKSMIDSNFVVPLSVLMKLLNMGAVTRDTIFFGNAGHTVMRFIAFAYTYHYLNWFSKTSVIKWHQVPKKWLALVLLLWLASVALYAYSYLVGLRWLFLISMMHVFLEFPLNFRSFIGIGQELRNLIAPPKAVAMAISTPNPKRKKKK